MHRMMEAPVQTTTASHAHHQSIVKQLNCSHKLITRQTITGGFAHYSSSTTYLIYFTYCQLFSSAYYMIYQPLLSAHFRKLPVNHLGVYIYSTVQCICKLHMFSEEQEKYFRFMKKVVRWPQVLNYGGQSHS